MPTDWEKLTFRVATPRDAEELRAIYAPYVQQTAITFEYEVPSIEEFAARISLTLEKYPYLVAEMGGRICAYAYASAFKNRAAYDHAIETSVYVEQNTTQLGVGTLLSTALENVLLAQNVFNLNVCIAVPACEDDPYLSLGSVLFHQKRGYSLVGRFHGCGYKFGRWYDMVWMEKLQGGHEKRLLDFSAAAASGSPVSDAPASDDAVAPFIPFSQLDAQRVRKLLQEALAGESEDVRRITSSAGAVVFRRAEEGLQVLMITVKGTRRSFPKGHIDQGESKEQTAKREVFEETGIKVSILPDFCYEVPSARKTDNRSIFFLLGEYEGGQLVAQKEEIDAAVWVPVDQVYSLISFANDRAMFEAALAEYVRRQ